MAKYPLLCFAVWTAMCSTCLYTGVAAGAQTNGKPEVDCKSVSAPEVDLTDAQCHALHYFFSSIAGLPVMNIKKVPVNQQESPWLVTEILVDRSSVAFSADGVCLFFRAGIYSESGSESKTVAQAISKEKAFEYALPVIRYCNAPLDLGEYECWFDNEGKKLEDSLERCRWRFRHRYKHENLAYIGPTLSITVSAYSGRLDLFIYRAPTPPRPEPSTPISMEDAAQITQAWITKKDNKTTRGRGSLARDTVEKTVKVVCLPNTQSGKDITRMRPLEARYCWGVPFTWMEDTFDGSRVGESYAAVDMETGEIIAAFGEL